MQTIFKGKNTTLTPSLRVYLEEKIIGPTRKLLGSKGNDDFPLLELEISRTTKHHRKGQVWMAEANLTLGKKLIRAVQKGENPHEVIDLVEAELTREIKAFKGKSKTKEIRGARKLKRMLRKPF